MVGRQNNYIKILHLITFNTSNTSAQSMTELFLLLERRMNKKWMEQMKELKYGGYTTLPNILSFKRKELSTKDHEFTNDHIVFIFNILIHDEGWVLYDQDLEHVASRSSLYRYRKELKALGYLDWPKTYTKTTDGKCTQSGFVYNLDGLFNRLEELYQDYTSQCQVDTSQCQVDTSQCQDEPLLTNTTITNTLSTNSSKDTTIDASIKAELSAPVGRQSTSNNTIELTEEQQELLDTWNDLYPNIKARNGDLKNLAQVDLDDINWYKPIEWWKYFCKDTDDKLISTSDRSLTLFLKNINKVVSWKDQLHYQLQKRLDFDLEKTLRNKLHEDLDINIRTENNIPKYYWYDKVTGNIICEATESNIKNMLESSADCLKMDIRRNRNYNKEQLEMTERLTNRKLKSEIRREDEKNKLYDEIFKKPRDKISFDAINLQMNLEPTEEDIFWE